MCPTCGCRGPPPPPPGWQQHLALSDPDDESGADWITRPLNINIDWVSPLKDFNLQKKQIDRRPLVILSIGEQNFLGVESGKSWEAYCFFQVWSHIHQLKRERHDSPTLIKKLDEYLVEIHEKAASWSLEDTDGRSKLQNAAQANLYDIFNCLGHDVNIKDKHVDWKGRLEQIRFGFTTRICRDNRIEFRGDDGKYQDWFTLTDVTNGRLKITKVNKDEQVEEV